MSLSVTGSTGQERLAALAKLDIISTKPDVIYDNIVALTAQLSHARICAIIFIGEENIWIKSITGAQLKSLPYEIIRQNIDVPDNGMLIIPDIHSVINCAEVLDEELQDIKYYVGLEFKSRDGHVLGHLCLMHSSNPNLDTNQIAALKLLVNQIEILLDKRLELLSLRKSNEAAQQTEAQLNAIFYNAIDAVILLEDNGNILRWNPSAEAVFGWRAIEVIGRNFEQLTIPDRFSANYHDLLLQKSLFNSKSNKVIDIKAIRKDGAEFDIALGITSTTISDRSGYIIFASNITQRQEGARQLVKQKKFYESILNSIPADVAVFDVNHRYIFVNPKAISVKEFRDFIIGKDDYEYAAFRNRDPAIADDRRAKFLQVINSGEDLKWEESLIDRFGKRLTILRALHTIVNEDGQVDMVIGYGMDITDRKLMEEQQASMLKQLTAQNVQLVDFCNIVSHNLRGPLVNMAMLVEFLEETDDREEQKLLTSKLKPVLENLNLTFNELVESIQIKQDVEIKAERILLSDCVERVIKSFEAEISKLNATIQINFDDAPEINFPSKYINSICHNLISNALKYHSPERLPVIKLETRKNDGNIIFTVSDNGLGIDVEKNKENFFKIGKVFHRHPNAKGFGLFMTKTQVEAMNGEIWLNSKPGAGTTFFIKFNNQNL